VLTSIIFKGGEEADLRKQNLRKSNPQHVNCYGIAFLSELLGKREFGRSRSS
jgi:hypothetical protein